MTRCPICDREHEWICTGYFTGWCSDCHIASGSGDNLGKVGWPLAHTIRAAEWAAARARAPLAEKVKRVEARIESLDAIADELAQRFGVDDEQALTVSKVVEKLRAALRAKAAEWRSVDGPIRGAGNCADELEALLVASAERKDGE